MTNPILKHINSFLRDIQHIFSCIQLKPYQLTRSLADFYTSQSVKRTNTRKKERPEFEIILHSIYEHFPHTHYHLNRNNTTQESAKEHTHLRIVELGCGDGRFAQYIDEKIRTPFSYVGIDVSGGLIQTAKERSFANQVQFLVGDMNSYLANLEQESVDIIISIASIQHLHKSSRQIMRNNAYRVLTFQGLHITANRSYSKRMILKHWKSIIIGVILRIFNYGTFSRHDYMIPFKTPKHQQIHTNQTSVFSIGGGIGRRNTKQELKIENGELRIDYRFYHLYLLGELLEYAHTAGFVVTKSGYISSDGMFNNDRKTSRNTYVVAKKDVGMG